MPWEKGIVVIYHPDQPIIHFYHGTASPWSTYYPLLSWHCITLVNLLSPSIMALHHPGQLIIPFYHGTASPWSTYYPLLSWHCITLVNLLSPSIMALHHPGQLSIDNPAVFCHTGHAVHLQSWPKLCGKLLQNAMPQPLIVFHMETKILSAKFYLCSGINGHLRSWELCSTGRHVYYRTTLSAANINRIGRSITMSKFHSVFQKVNTQGTPNPRGPESHIHIEAHTRLSILMSVDTAQSVLGPCCLRTIVS